jgi:hypothetical protein
VGDGDGVGPLDGAKPREVLINKENLEKLFGGPTGLGFEQDSGEEDNE